MSSKVRQAIEQRSRLRLHFKGNDIIVEPYAFGLDQDGEPLLLCFQADTEAMLNTRNGWKVIPLSEVTSIDFLDEACARTQPGYIRNHPAFHTILIRVSSFLLAFYFSMYEI
jgi:hypothetical protein